MLLPHRLQFGQHFGKSGIGRQPLLIPAAEVAGAFDPRLRIAAQHSISGIAQHFVSGFAHQLGQSRAVGFLKRLTFRLAACGSRRVLGVVQLHRHGRQQVRRFGIGLQQLTGPVVRGPVQLGAGHLDVRVFHAAHRTAEQSQGAQ